jgi:hypothetical protein
MTTQGKNSAAPTTAQVIGGVYNATPPVLVDGQAAAIQLDVNGKIQTTGGGGGGTSDVNIKDVNGAPPALTNPLPVELSDGTNALGVSGNPLFENLAQVAGSTVATAATGVQKVGVVGNAGAAIDGATAASVPANALLEGARGATTFPTAVTDGQMVAVMADKAGRTISVANAPRDLIGTVMLNSSSNSLVSFIGLIASTFTDIITFIATNESSTATIVSLSDGTVSYKFALAANGGIVINFPTPLPATSSATAWQVLNSAGVAVDYVAVYAKNK